MSLLWPYNKMASIPKMESSWSITLGSRERTRHLHCSSPHGPTISSSVGLIRSKNLLPGFHTHFFLSFNNCQIKFHQIHSKLNPWVSTLCRFQTLSVFKHWIILSYFPLMLRVAVTDEVTHFVLLLGKILVSGIVGEYWYLHGLKAVRSLETAVL